MGSEQSLLLSFLLSHWQVRVEQAHGGAPFASEALSVQLQTEKVGSGRLHLFLLGQGLYAAELSALLLLLLLDLPRYVVEQSVVMV
jgi:hypothetical protein